MKDRSRLLLLTLLTATSILGFAQTGAVSGVVLDHAEGSTLPGANIYLKGNQTTGTVTDIDGKFVLNGLEIGDHVVVVSFIGFVVQEISVQINAELGSELKVLLEPDAVLGREVIVMGQALGQAKAINQQLNAESIANMVSSDRIQELPDVNAAEAIARLPGVSINRDGGEGQKVVIRGLEPKFNAVTVNGIRMPANDSGDRSVDLSLISPEMLEGIEVFKAPLPYMDAEAVGGTVNLKLRKAAPDLKVVAKLLGGYNDLNNDWGDYKGVLQGSERIFADKLGIVLQGSLERFNRGGDFSTYDWLRGATDATTGNTDISGNMLVLENRAEVRRRLNASMNLDYDLGGNHSITLFGLHSKTERDRFDQRQVYERPNIFYSTGQVVESDLILSTLALGGEHPFGKLLLNWKIGHSRSEGSTPYDFTINFQGADPFDMGVDRRAHPRTYLDLAAPDYSESFIYGEDEHRSTNTLEELAVAMVDLKIPVKTGDRIGGYIKFGAKYLTVDRSRQVTLLTGDKTLSGYTPVAKAYGAEKLMYTRANIVSMLSFTGHNFDFKDPDGNTIANAPRLDPNLLRDWQDAQAQIGLLQNDRSAEDDRYLVTESIAAGYAMLRLNIGKVLTVIPGFRFEQSDNNYTASVSTVSGDRGINGFFRDTTTFRKYGEFLPHLHLKYQALDWFDIRASYTETLARPDYYYVTPRAEINNTDTYISAGNPNLRHARASNFDLYFSAYKGGLGLFSFGAFSKNIDDIFYPSTIHLADPAIAAANGWPEKSGFELESFTNAEQSTVKGFEMDLQTNLGFLPKPFNGMVINANYARLYSETQVFFLTSETVLIRPFPPLQETTYTSNERLVTMPSQAPHILHLSLGYDMGGFSARISGVFQGTKANSYSVNKDFDEYTLEFWRWDASLKQDLGTYWSFFVNLNNFNNQQDISFTRNKHYLNTIQTFGFTSTAGVQFRL